MRRALLSLSLLVAACSSNSAPANPPEEAGAPQGAPCVLTSDCAVELLCGYPIEAGCAAQGVCVPEDLSCPTDGPVVCACDGTPAGLACIYGVGYAVVPIVDTTPGCLPMSDGGLFD